MENSITEAFAKAKNVCMICGRELREMDYCTERRAHCDRKCTSYIPRLPCYRMDQILYCSHCKKFHVTKK